MGPLAVAPLCMLKVPYVLLPRYRALEFTPDTGSKFLECLISLSFWWLLGERKQE